MRDLKTINVQSAFFTKELISRPDTLYYKLLSEIGDVIDQQPIINNMPDEVPPDFPRIISSSADNKFQFNVSKNRVDLFINFKEEDADNESNYALFKSMSNNLCKQINSIIGVNRIGIITTTISHDDELKELFIDGYFKKIDKVNLSEAEFRTNNIRTFKDKEINNIKRLSIGEIQSLQFNGNCLLIQLDHNNKTLFTTKTEWIEMLDHLMELSSPTSAYKAANGE